MLWLWATSSWLVGVFLVTLYPQAWGMEPGRALSLVPFASFGGSDLGVGNSVLFEVAANCLMFLIGGFLLQFATDKPGRIVGFCLGMAVLVEVLQYAFAASRVASVDDVIWAGVGSAVGLFLARAMRKHQRETAQAGV
ncbi:VanZ family protein [Zhihengliuella alba]